MQVRKLHVFNPTVANEDPSFCNSDKEVYAKAEAVLAELRGLKMVKQQPDGSSLMVESGWSIPKAKDIKAVPFIRRDGTNEVRWVELHAKRPGARNLCVQLVQGQWRLATDAEAQKALDGDAAKRAAIVAEQDRVAQSQSEKAMERTLGVMEAVAKQSAAAAVQAMTEQAKDKKKPEKHEAS